ncbi:MAG: hypothetical protein KIT60_15955 [Burkholderiaceae bacterium]|nr:hypothetical protein [Burkholderiaceae bacterium]
MASLLVACIPIRVGEQHVTPTVRSEPVDAQWDPMIGPDVHLAFAYKFKTAMRQQSDKIEFVEPDDMWKAAFAEQGTEARLSQVLAARSGAGVADPGVRFIVVLGPESKPVRKQVKEVAAFYSKWTEETTREAVLVGIATPEPERIKVIATAVGEEKDGWVPDTPLMLARLYTTTDTEESALNGVARQIVDRILALSREWPVPMRVVVFAQKVAP